MTREGPTKLVSVQRGIRGPWPDRRWATCNKCGRAITYRHAAYREQWTDSHGNVWATNYRHADCHAPMYGVDQ